MCGMNGQHLQAMFSTNKGPEQVVTWSCKSVTHALTNIASEQRTIEVCKGVSAKRTRRKPELSRSVAVPPQGGTAARHWSWRSSFGAWRPVLLYEIDRHSSSQKLIIVAASANGVRCAPRVCKHPAVVCPRSTQVCQRHSWRYSWRFERYVVKSVFVFVIILCNASMVYVCRTTAWSAC